MKIKVGDMVKVIAGKDKGMSGVVDRVFEKNDRVFVRGINVWKKHVKRNNKGEGGIIDLTRPINVSKVMVVCPECGKATRVGIVTEEGKKFRVCKKCGKKINIISKVEEKKPSKKVTKSKKVKAKTKV